MILWLFELGYILQHIATVMQIVSIHRRRSIELVSIDTNYMFMLGAICRLLWMHDSMLSNFALAYLEVLAALASLGIIIYLYHQHRKQAMAMDLQFEDDIPFYFRATVLIPTVLVLGFIFHPGEKNDYYLSLQMLVSISIFAEAIGLIPQLWIIKTQKDVGNLNTNYGLILAASRFFRLCFWFQMYLESNTFVALILADAIHTVVLGDFTYNVFKNKQNYSLSMFSNAPEDKSKKVF